MILKPDALFELLKFDLSDDASTGAALAAKTLQRDQFLKKLSDSSHSSTRRETALKSFEERARREAHHIAVSLFEARGFIDNCIEDLDPGLVVRDFRHGPGSSIGMYMRSTSGFMKTAHGVITVSSEALYAEYLGLLASECPDSYAAEILRRYRYGGPAITNFNKVTTVPKTSSVDRVIAIEPIINGLFQQSIRALLERSLNKVNIDLATQPIVNRRLAQIGSCTGMYATIDLSNASDSISWQLVEKLFPQPFVDYLRLVCCDANKIGNRLIEKTQVPFSMGNAITFPLQTLIFLALANQVYSKLGLLWDPGTSVSVFGDDIVVMTEAYAPLVSLLTECGLVVNTAKSFSEGPFRESCGADWHLGKNIRPVMPKRLDSVMDVFVLRNQLAAWSHRWFPLPSVLAYIDHYLRETGNYLLVPMNAMIDSGVRTYVPVLRDDYKCSQTQNIRYRGMTIVFSQRNVSRYAACHPGFITLGHIAGYLRDNILCERPLSKGRLRRKWFNSLSWDEPNTTDSWMYDDSNSSFEL